MTDTEGNARAILKEKARALGYAPVRSSPLLFLPFPSCALI